ncbi:phosphoglycerate kinase [Halovivax limisalsi]|uniref:phosphoglycerate kinase n=1 Tax=Halovivax limisalsi TaxID=1453760 RepID=UPI001FFC4962|nr:phosphoglycerate kinase [Halovivax limisalsi]
MIETLDDLDARGTVVGVRVDVNSPVEDETLLDDSRLQAHVPTLETLLDRGARVAVLAHQGRPGGDDFATLSAHADWYDDALSFPVSYVDETHGRTAREAIEALADGECLFLENTRFYSEEYMEFDPERAAETHLVSRLAPVLDVYVNDAFAASHRSQPSLVGFPAVLPSYAGHVLERELAALGDVESTARPRTYALGGAKVSGALDVAERVLEDGLADTVLASGLVGNVFLSASGVNLGDASSNVIYERGFFDEIDRAADLLEAYGDRIEFPRDVAVERDGERVELDRSDLPADDDLAMDVGSRTIEAYTDVFADSETVILNGPAGVYENAAFERGTRELFEAATAVPTSIVGGGDTASALRQLGVDGFSHVSTGGGAALTLLTGDPLPAVEALEDAPVRSTH